MLSPEDLVSIYIDDFRPMPTELLLLIFEISGHVGRGQRSMHFWVYISRPLPRGRVSFEQRLAGRSQRRRR